MKPSPPGVISHVQNEFTSYFSFDGDWAYYTVENKLYRASIEGETYTLPDDQSDYNNEQGIKDQVRETVFEKPMYNALIKDG